MRRLLSAVVVALACLALTPATGASAQGGVTPPVLTVPPDWPKSVPVPAGEITGIHRDLVGNITLDMVVAGSPQVAVPRIDARYIRAGFTLDPASHNPRYYTRFRYIVTVFYGAHDFTEKKTNLVITETFVPKVAAAAYSTGKLALL